MIPDTHFLDFISFPNLMLLCQNLGIEELNYKFVFFHAVTMSTNSTFSSIIWTIKCTAMKLARFSL